MSGATIFVGAGDADQYLLLKYGNRHGLIAGATGTGKTVTLQTIAEGFAGHGVPVLLADVKGDLSGMGRPGGDHPKAVERARLLKIRDYGGRAFPTRFWDLFGEKGHPIRTTVSEVGPVLTRSRKASSTSPSGWPMRRDGCCSTSRTCRRCCNGWPPTPAS
jgi:DNA helicase HerA-like ATPase